MDTNLLFWIWTIPFWTLAPQGMFTSILALYKCFLLTYLQLVHMDADAFADTAERSHNVSSLISQQTQKSYAMKRSSVKGTIT